MLDSGDGDGALEVGVEAGDGALDEERGGHQVIRSRFEERSSRRRRRTEVLESIFLSLSTPEEKGKRAFLLERVEEPRERRFIPLPDNQLD